MSGLSHLSFASLDSPGSWLLSLVNHSQTPLLLCVYLIHCALTHAPRTRLYHPQIQVCDPALSEVVGTDMLEVLTPELVITGHGEAG